MKKLLKRNDKLSIMYKIFLSGLLVILTSFNCDKRTKDPPCYNYRLLDCTSIETGIKIFFDTTQIGSVKTIELPSSLKYCFGKIETIKNFKIYSNMEFMLEEQIIGSAIVRINVNMYKPSNLLDITKDTIFIESRRVIK